MDLSSNTIEDIIRLDESYYFHLARILILMDEMAKKPYGEFIEGITKLVKLDFLLRYPTVLEKALIKKGKSAKFVDVKEHERENVESKMIRYKFGPWDKRYYEFLRILEGLGLIKIGNEDGTTLFRITEEGRQICKNLNNIEIFKDYVKRSKIITSAFGENKANYLVKMSYGLRPELSEMKLGEVIEP